MDQPPDLTPIIDEEAAETRLERLIKLSAHLDPQASSEEVTHALYRSITERSRAIIYIEVPDPDQPDQFTDLYVSPQVEEWFGYPPEEWMRDYSAWRRVVYPEDRQRVLDAIEKSMNGGPYSIEYRMRNKTGGLMWVHDEAVLISSDDGDPLYWQGFMSDITDRKRAEDLEQALAAADQVSEELRELNAMKDTLLEAVSHDFRTPLAVIKGLAQTLLRSEINLDEDDRRDFLERILKNSRKLEGLVEDLLDLDRLQRGILQLDEQVTDVGGRVALIVRELEEESHPIFLDISHVMARVDASKLERMVENLLVNAQKHTPAGTRVWVRVSREQGYVLLVVEDDGPGVADEVKEVLFEPFRQGQAHLANPGVGLGLSLVRRLADLHGGSAWVQDREGGGASFRVLLPAAD